MIGFGRPHVRAKLLTLALVSLALAGCSSDLEGVLSTFSDAATLTDDAVLDPDSVEARFLNYSFTAAIEVEFYATNVQLDDTTTELFMPEHFVSSGIGLAATGIIEPAHQDSITFPCTASLTLGTAGGRFLDRDTGELLGAGAARWVTDAQLGLCGRVVTFEFTDTDGTFAVNLRVE